ncbi:MAG: citramalate synthase [Candidatus Ancillula sp.]|jgi:2-isopropylmalate synthase|nr:citramalate synthase [Candidatus Ancillula sp.]
MRKIDIYDTTLRDGAQQQGVNFSVQDKLQIAELLQGFGVTFIEGGWPGAILKDTSFFQQASATFSEKLTAFGATRKPNVRVEDDAQVQALLDSGTKTVCVVAKSDARHISEALRTTVDENLKMTSETVDAIVKSDKVAFVDAEHFFDGFRHSPDVAVEVVAAAFKAGAKCVILCDTNGGSLPSEIGATVAETIRALEQKYNIKVSDSAEDDAQYLGIHAHNDTGCAVANSIEAVKAGVAHVQGTINEFGERTGNANLLTVIANLQLKLGIDCVPNLEKAYNLAHDVAEIANVNINQRQPYVGDIAFAHKAGLHASAIKVNPDLYQHISPDLVGNDLRMIISEMAGKSSIALKADELGFNLKDTPEVMERLTERVKALEAGGYAFDMADASFELLLREELNLKPKYFNVESWRTISERQGPRGTEALSEATVKLTYNDKRVIATGEGNGPVNALDEALRQAISDFYPQVRNFVLKDYRVRLLDTSSGTDSITRVLITCYNSDTNKSWSTVGVGGNIVESSWEALTDCYIYGLIQLGVVNG